MNILGLALVAGALMGNPQGGTVVSGTATIETAGRTMTIRQGTEKAIINWQRFENTASETVRFIQPGATSLALNRVVGVDPSSISGALSANGRVFLLNPNGVVFGPTARVNVGSIVASTLAITDADFTSNNFRLLQTSGAELGAVVNQGNITVAPGGTVALIAPIVSNDGTIVAAAGRVFLVGSADATVQLDPGDVTNIQGGGGLAGGRIPTIGLSPLLESVINTSSIASPVGAARVERLSDGTTFLRGAGGIVANGGTIDTSGGAGQITIHGANSVALGAGSLIDAGAGNVSIKAGTGNVYQHRLDGATPAPAFVRGNDIIVEAKDQIRTTDSQDFRIEGTGKVTLRGRDMVGRGDSKIQVKAGRLDVLAERGEVALHVEGDTIADQVLAGIDNTFFAGQTLNFSSTGTVIGGSGFVHFNGKSVTLDIAGDLGAPGAEIVIGEGGRGDTRTLNLNVAGDTFFPPFGAGVRLQNRQTNQDQFNATAASASPLARSDYIPPVDAPDVVATPPVALPADPGPIAPTAPSVSLADATPAPSTSGGSTVGAADNVLLPALRTDRSRGDAQNNSGGSSQAVADGSGGLIDVVSSTPAPTELDGSSPAPETRDERLAQVRRRVREARQQAR